MHNFDPFVNFAPTPESPASLVFNVVPSDDDELPRGIRCLRIFNSTDSIALLAIHPLNGDTMIQLPIPPLTVIWEPIRVSKVFETGTDPALMIHGYSD